MIDFSSIIKLSNQLTSIYQHIESIVIRNSNSIKMANTNNKSNKQINAKSNDNNRNDNSNNNDNNNNTSNDTTNIDTSGSKLVSNNDNNPNKKSSNASDNAASKLIIDSLVGAFAGFSLAWLITPMDAAVMQNMSGQATLSESLLKSGKRIATKPHYYIRRPEFHFVVGTYGGTYLAKNYTDSVCKITNQSAEATAFYKFWLVFAVNGGLSVFWKDPGLARIFSSGNSVKKPTPRSTFFSWIARDTIHIIGAAVLPDYLEQKYKLTQDQWRVVQLTFPLLVQTLTTPCHLLGLDYYNIEKSTVRDRFGRIARAWLPSVSVRMVRMFAPWSIGLLINRDLRDYLNAEYTKSK